MPFTFEKTGIAGLFIIQPKKFGDDRGWFSETYKRSDFENMGIREEFVQDNHSVSVRGVLRGLHFQRAPYGQGKLVRCVQGEVWDVAVDLRKNSETYGESLGLILSAENRKMFYIPPGFAHGFYTISDEAVFLYKVTAEYVPDYDGGIRFDDPNIAIQWPIQTKSPLISAKDEALPYLSELGEGYSL
jgi:dTDP-4-dehydrorhamnose 3,5-epimerase